jgi:CRP-like cAMP-binding protein
MIPVSPVPELPALGILTDLDSAARAALAACGECLDTRPGELVIEQGGAQDHLYIVLIGVLHARRTDTARDLLLGRIEAGESFGEVNLFDPGKAAAAVISAQSARLWRISRTGLRAFLTAHPAAGVELLEGIAATLSKRLRKMGDRVVSESSLSDTLAELRVGT